MSSSINASYPTNILGYPKVSMISSFVAPAFIACWVNALVPSMVPCEASSAIAIRSLTFLGKTPFGLDETSSELSK
jgi:hypothetical protein